VTSDVAHSLVVRLAGPLQSWGSRSQFNRRDSAPEPTKSGIAGLLAAAQGRRRQDPIEDLAGLRLGVRTDRPGTLLRDYHTVSDLRGRPLLAAAVRGTGLQQPTSPAKYIHVTHRYYLQDAVFVAAVSGPPDLLHALAHALAHPAFPLALGRRGCPPTMPLLVPPADGADRLLWASDPVDVLRDAVPWQVSEVAKNAYRRSRDRQASVRLPITVDDPEGDDLRTDVPVSFDPPHRAFTSRRVTQAWAEVPTGAEPSGDRGHDPFALLGW
jgi:CRISPR system Cascade subunit CasD